MLCFAPGKKRFNWETLIKHINESDEIYGLFLFKSLNLILAF